GHPEHVEGEDDALATDLRCVALSQVPVPDGPANLDAGLVIDNRASTPPTTDELSGAPVIGDPPGHPVRCPRFSHGARHSLRLLHGPAAGVPLRDAVVLEFAPEVTGMPRLDRFEPQPPRVARRVCRQTSLLHGGLTRPTSRPRSRTAPCR